MLVTIIDYGSGNLHSMHKAFETVAKNARILITNDPKKVAQADRIVLPGVGTFSDCLTGLTNLPGMLDTLTTAVQQHKKPFLGVCVGMQMLADYGHEHQKTKGLGWIPGEVIAIKPTSEKLRIPHMGWNNLSQQQQHPIFHNIANDEHFYFVHSYFFQCTQQEHVLATVTYGQTLPAVIAQDNIIATQFHPEKSQKTGLQFIENFLNIE